jgi:hypothetical protein
MIFIYAFLALFTTIRGFLPKSMKKYFSDIADLMDYSILFGIFLDANYFDRDFAVRPIENFAVYPGKLLVY